MKRYILTMLLAIAAVFAHADNSLWKHIWPITTSPG